MFRVKTLTTFDKRYVYYSLGCSPAVTSGILKVKPAWPGSYVKVYGPAGWAGFTTSFAGNFTLVTGLVRTSHHLSVFKTIWKGKKIGEYCYVQRSYLMSLLSPVKHPKLRGCYVIHKYCIEEEFNIVKLKGWSLYFLLRIVLSTKKQVVHCTRNEEAFWWIVVFLCMASILYPYISVVLYCCISPYGICIISVLLSWTMVRAIANLCGVTFLDLCIIVY